MAEEKKQVEGLVNENITKKLDVWFEKIPYEEAKKLIAQHTK